MVNPVLNLYIVRIDEAQDPVVLDLGGNLVSVANGREGRARQVYNAVLTYNLAVDVVAEAAVYVILMLIIGRVFTPLYANITRIPYELMSAIIIVYCITGVYSSEASTFQVLLAVIIGAFSFVLRKLGFGVVPIILGVVLGDLVETNFRNSMVMSSNSLSIFVTRPFSLLFLALAVLSIGMFFYKAAKDRKKQKTELN